MMITLNIKDKDIKERIIAHCKRTGVLQYRVIETALDTWLRDQEVKQETK